MLPYLIPFIFTFICSIRYDINGRTDIGRKISFGVLFVYLTILLGIRYKVGGDTVIYMKYYEWQPDLETFKFTFGNLIQPGYNLICATTKSVSPEFYVFQIVHALIVNTLIFIFLWKNTKYIFSALLTLFFVCYLYFTCEIMRESIAVLIFAFLCKPLYKGEWLKYYLGVVICVMFHLSAIVLVVFPLLRGIKFNKAYLLLMIIAAIAMVGMKSILSFFSGFLIIGEKIAHYGDENHGLLADFLVMLRKSIFPIFFALIVKYGCHRRLKYENQISLLGLFGLMAFFNPVIFGRITNYLIIFFVISFADEIVSFVKSHNVRLKHNAVVLLLCFVFTYGSYFVLYNNYKLYLPYSSILNPVEYNRFIFDR